VEADSLLRVLKVDIREAREKDVRSSKMAQLVADETQNAGILPAEAAMSNIGFKHIFGPVPSRRLGRSLGIDLVPYKTCTYDCIYCQLGKTNNLTIDRKEFFATDEIIDELKIKLSGKDLPDYISLAGSGEPTLNSGIGKLICEIKRITDIPLAILTNGSLLWMKDVQDALLKTDLVIPSLDVGNEKLFQYVNRPHKDLSFDRMVDGISEFTGRFSGEVWLEALLLEDITSSIAEVQKIADLAARIKPARVQINSVSRPPTEDFAFRISQEKLLSLKGLFSGQVDIISDTEESHNQNLPLTAVKEDEIPALLSRRPCTIDDIATGLGMHPAEALKYLDRLMKDDKIKATTNNGKVFYSVVINS
jgi:wyosine [tRNA(Phe)-imidazoG37] synthetase (radical SAM superfamily)